MCRRWRWRSPPRSQSGAKQFDIRLDPPELGRVEVRLSIDATGKASAHLSADQPQTLDLLQKDAPALTRALRDAGPGRVAGRPEFLAAPAGSQDSWPATAASQAARGRAALRAHRHHRRIEATATSAAYRAPPMAGWTSGFKDTP